MHAPSRFLLDGLQLCLHAIPPGLPFSDLQFAAERVLPQIKVKPRKVKVSGLPSPRRSAVFRREASRTRSSRDFSEVEATVQTPVTAYASRRGSDGRRSRTCSKPTIRSSA